MKPSKRPGLLNRREFTAQSALALLSGVAVTVGGCSGGSDSPTSPSPTPAPGDPNAVGSIAANHGHSAVITGAELMAGGDLSLNIRGGANHPHTVELTGLEVAQIANGGRVVVISSDDDGHTHRVTFG